jgi:P-type E1-E2 ATPase
MNSASSSLKNREEKIKECRSHIEKNMEFLAVTGVEDKLQAGVVETVASLRSIGVRVWMLTGDKIETAICVGRAVKLIKGRE